MELVERGAHLAARDAECGGEVLREAGVHVVRALLAEVAERVLELGLVHPQVIRQPREPAGPAPLDHHARAALAALAVLRDGVAVAGLRAESVRGGCDRESPAHHDYLCPSLSWHWPSFPAARMRSVRTA